MRSLYDDILTTLRAHDFSIADVAIREPFDESPKDYPFIVVHEIVNTPMNHATVSGEERTLLTYQCDIHTQNSRTRQGDVLNRWRAGRLLYRELDALLEDAYKMTRKYSPPPVPIASDVLMHIWRGSCTLDSHEYSYRR